ncbi:hypothetical protein RHS01_10579 [Rhizoctonia solani]|uniref:Zn(2)-C6 fungal-type domain-containing protein n=1 Tax=Rhizoctonia solani TaxID=456999 RepID=A0A8H7I4H5_9AGAM|nr:hypothetical protein RHS01_10579 [Rhizoctonia solani]
MNAATMEYAHTNQRRVQPTALTMHHLELAHITHSPIHSILLMPIPQHGSSSNTIITLSPGLGSRNPLSPNAFNTQGYSSDYLTPSPRSSHPDSWSASSNQWVSPRESPIMASAAAPPAWNANAAEVTWNSGIGTFLLCYLRSTSGASDNDTWAITTARGKRLRTDESQKVKTGACKNCKRLKMKCTFDPPGSATCQRCRGNGHDCIVEGRKPRKNSEPLEQLSALIDDKQEIIDGLLRIVSAHARREHRRGHGRSMALDRTSARSLMPAQPSGEDPEVGNEKSACRPIRPHRPISRSVAQRSRKGGWADKGMSSSKSQTEEGDDVGRQCRAVIAIIDPVIHTVAGVKARSPAHLIRLIHPLVPLCPATVCAIAPVLDRTTELYKVLMHYAKSAAATAITDGWKSLEVCQAYLLLSVYPQPAKSWAEDRGWLYLGCAIRLAMDLGLYKQASKTDRALATRLGRPTTIPEDYIVRHSREWWRRSKYNGRLDVHLCYYTQLLRTVTRYFSLIYSDPESVSGFNESTEFGPITRAFDDEMEQFKQDAEHAYSTAPESRHPTCQYRLALMPLAVAYYRLVMYSFGLEHAHRSASEPGNMFLIRAVMIQSVDTASEVLRITNEDLPIHEYHRYSPDGHWMWSVFAAAFLIKLAKPRSVQPPHLTMTETQRETSLVLVEKFIHTLECSAVDDRHSPALYARFLRRIMGKR